MSFRFTLLMVLLVLLASISQQVSGAESQEWTDVLAAYEQLEATEPYLKKAREAVDRTVAMRCSSLDRQCVSFSRERPDMVLAAVPDNPEFWSAYDSVLAARPVPVEHIDLDDLPAYSEFIEGTKVWLRRELVTSQIADVERLEEHLSAHRRRLAMSNTLIDKMIFLATTRILLPGINVHMAHREATGLGADQRMLDDLLEPLAPEELSIRRAMDGELRLAAKRIQQDSNEVGTLNEIDRFYTYVSDRSEADWEDFWLNGLNLHENVPGLLLDEEWLPDLANYAANIRNVDATLLVLQALRGIYEGRVSPGIPAQPPPAGWYWDWQEETQSLCLEPGSIHATLDHPDTICLEYLDRNLFL